MVYNRGDIVLIDLIPTVGSVQGGKRIGIIIQNNIGNKFSTTLIVGLLTTKLKHLPTHVIMQPNNINNLKFESMFLGEQIVTVDKTQIFKKTGNVDNFEMMKIDNAVRISLAV